MYSETIQFELYQKLLPGKLGRFHSGKTSEFATLPLKSGKFGTILLGTVNGQCLVTENTESKTASRAIVSWSHYCKIREDTSVLCWLNVLSLFATIRFFRTQQASSCSPPGPHIKSLKELGTCLHHQRPRTNLHGMICP